MKIVKDVNKHNCPIWVTCPRGGRASVIVTDKGIHVYLEFSIKDTFRSHLLTDNICYLDPKLYKSINING